MLKGKETVISMKVTTSLIIREFKQPRRQQQRELQKTIIGFITRIRNSSFGLNLS